MPEHDQARGKGQPGAPQDNVASGPAGTAGAAKHPAGKHPNDKPGEHPKGGGEAVGEHSKDAPQTPSHG